MNLQEACQKVIEFCGEKHFSQILKGDYEWFFKVCDENGCDLPMHLVMVQRLIDEVGYFTPPESVICNLEEEEIPKEYWSNKHKVIDYVIVNNKYADKYISVMDVLYEKFNLYSIDLDLSYGVLNYYLHSIIDLDDTNMYKFIEEDTRSVEDLIKLSEDFLFLSPEVVKLKEVFDVLSECCRRKHRGLDYSDLIMPEPEINDYIVDAARSLSNYFLCGDKLVEIYRNRAKDIFVAEAELGLISNEIVKVIKEKGWEIPTWD